MSTYQDLLKQRDALSEQIEQARKRETSDAVARVRALMQEYQLSPNDIFPAGRKARAKGMGMKVSPKYRDPATGQTWTGRGKAPKWIADRDRTPFLIR
jgi:DNA-binding protein H-NS